MPSTISSDFPALRQNLTTLIEHVSGRIQQVEDTAAGILNAGRKFNVASIPAGPPAPGATTLKKSRKTAPAPPPPQNPPGFIPEVRIHEDNPISALIYSQLGTLYQYAILASFVPLLVYFMLSWRDHIYKSFLRFFEGPARVTVSQSLQGIAGVARAFVVGNFIIGMLLAGASSAMFAVIHLPKEGDPRALATFFPGLLFGWMRSATGSILASTITHGCSNILARCLELAVSR